MFHLIQYIASTPYTNGVYTSISGVEQCRMLLQSPLRLSQFVCQYHSCVSSHVLEKLTGSHKNGCVRIQASGDGESQGVSYYCNIKCLILVGWITCMRHTHRITFLYSQQVVCSATIVADLVITSNNIDNQIGAIVYNAHLESQYSSIY